jgi:hypothetical protein
MSSNNRDIITALKIIDECHGITHTASMDTEDQTLLEATVVNNKLIEQANSHIKSKLLEYVEKLRDFRSDGNDDTSAIEENIRYQISYELEQILGQL